MSKQNDLLSEYKKEVHLLKRRIKSAEKRGFIFDKPIVPKQPKKITEKSIAKVKNLRSEQIRAKSIGRVDFSSGELKSKKVLKKSKIEIEYHKALTNLKKRIKRAKKAGFIFNDNIIPKSGKATKANIIEVNKLKGDILRRRAEGFKTNTGEIVSPEEGIKQTHRKKVPEEPEVPEIPQEPEEPEVPETPEEPEDQDFESDYDRDAPSEGDIVIDMLYDLINNFVPETYWSESLKAEKLRVRAILSNYLNYYIATFGKDRVAQHAINYADKLIAMVERMLYDSEDEGVYLDYTEFIQYIAPEPLTEEQNAELTAMTENTMMYGDEY